VKREGHMEKSALDPADFEHKVLIPKRKSLPLDHGLCLPVVPLLPINIYILYLNKGQSGFFPLLAFVSCVLHICDTAWLGHPHFPEYPSFWGRKMKQAQMLCH
jgi:hypothetical protein